MDSLRLIGTLLIAACALGCGEEDVPQYEEPAATPAPRMEPLADSAFRVEWGTPGVPCSVPPGHEFAVGVVATNAGDGLWLDPDHADANMYAAGAVRLSYRWWKAGGEAPFRDYGPERGDLLDPIRPGQSAVLALPVKAPAEPGSYQLQLDLVQEMVSWFEAKGAKTLRVPVTVK